MSLRRSLGLGDDRQVGRNSIVLSPMVEALDGRVLLAANFFLKFSPDRSAVFVKWSPHDGTQGEAIVAGQTGAGTATLVSMSPWTAANGRGS